MKRVLFVFFCVVLVLAALPVAAQETISVGSVVEGDLGAESEVVYQLTLEAGQGVLINLNSADFDTTLEVRNLAGMTLQYNDDSSFGTDSQLAFVAPESAAYQIVVSGFKYNDNGHYQLSVQNLTTQSLTFNTPVSATFSDESPIAVFTFEGTAGDVISVSAQSDGSLDTYMTLYDPNGNEVAYNDDSGSSYDPAISKQPLSVDGIYTVVVEPYSSGDAGEISVTLEQAQLASLDGGPVMVDLSQTYVDRVSFNAQADTAYRFTVRTVGGEEGNPSVSFISDDYTLPYVSGSNVIEMSFVYRAAETGLMLVEVSDYFGAAYEISVTPAE
ncbi:MAG: hypothetical protein D6712_02495 [Chloroflexi bacterium]|nr:MAG: hypothetical protein D6712_02495 [Chloroflexota bacterium]